MENKIPKISIFPKNEENESNFQKIFHKLNELKKGIKLTKSEEDSQYKIAIDNKYYQAELFLNFFDENNKKDEDNQSEALIIIGDALTIDLELFRKLIKHHNTATLILICFREDLSTLEGAFDYNNFKDFCIENNIEAITNIFRTDYEDMDDGFIRFNDALQANVWSKIERKPLNSNIGSSTSAAILTHASISNNLTKEVIDDEHSGYKKFEDEGELDNMESIIEQIKNLKTQNFSASDNVSDEQRRQNAEAAIMMLAKYLNLDDEGEGDDEEDEENSDAY